MKKEELAEMLDGVEYGNEIPPHIEAIMSEHGLVAVFGYSDDNCEFRGAINEEIPCWNGRRIYFNKDGSNFTNSHGEAFLTYHQDMEEVEPNMIEAVWVESEKVYAPKGGHFSWTYKTEIPHVTFDVFEGGEPYCRGIIFHVNDLK